MIIPIRIPGQGEFETGVRQSRGAPQHWQVNRIPAP